MFVNWTNMGFEDGFGVWSMDMDMDIESLHRLMVNFAKEILLEDKEREKERKKKADGRIYKGEWKTWKQYGFSS